MRSGAPFDQVLADKLGRSCQDGPVAHGRAGYGFRPDPVVLLFHTGFSPAGVSPARVAGAYGVRRRPRPVDPASPPPRRRARRILTPRQQAALDFLASQGAALPADFSEHELRRAFRTLARRLHPDGHPGCSEFESARLARQFAMLHDAYQSLRPARPAPPPSAA
jgi:hypothetical protein